MTWQRYLYSLFLTAALFFSNLGLAVTIHYCGHDVEKVVIGYGYDANCEHTASEKACCKEEKKSKEDCCSDQIIKQQKDDVVVQNFTLQFAPCILSYSFDFTPPIFAEPSVRTQHIFEYAVQANAPPLYKLYQQFLLYA
jgi:hypothetical protein